MSASMWEYDPAYQRSTGMQEGAITVRLIPSEVRKLRAMVEEYRELTKGDEFYAHMTSTDVRKNWLLASAIGWIDGVSTK